MAKEKKKKNIEVVEAQQPVAEATEVALQVDAAAEAPPEVEETAEAGEVIEAEPETPAIVYPPGEEPKWYVVHTRTGYENKVKTDLEKTVENRNLGDKIVEIKVPMEEVVEVKNGKRKVSQRRIYPCYIMVKMVMNSETWYVVRNAPGVTGFVGPGSDPVPLTDEEVAAMGVERIPIVIDIEEGESVRIISGTFDNFIGTVRDIDREKQTMHVLVNMFGRDMPVEVEFHEVVKL